MTSAILSLLVMIEIDPLLHMRYIIPAHHCKDPKTEFSIGNQYFKILQTPSLFPLQQHSRLIKVKAFGWDL